MTILCTKSIIIGLDLSALFEYIIGIRFFWNTVYNESQSCVTLVSFSTGDLIHNFNFIHHN